MARYHHWDHHCRNCGEALTGTIYGPMCFKCDLRDTRP